MSDIKLDEIAVRIEANPKYHRLVETRSRYSILMTAAVMLVYFGYILLRGHLLGVYPYPFVDVDKLGYALTIMNASGILAGFIVVAVLVVGLDRWK